MNLGIAKAAALVGLVTALGEAVDAYLHPHGLVMFYLLAVVVAAQRWGRGPAVVASALSVVLLNFFFVPPRYTLRVNETEYFLTFGALLIVGVLVSDLTGRLREQVELAGRRQAETDAAYAFSRTLSQAGDMAAVEAALVRHLGPLELEVLPEGSRASGLVVPLASGGTLRVEPSTRPGDELQAESMVRQAALAVERIRLSEEARRVEVLSEAERLHTALLNTISHDLQTPLASIQGALESLEDPELELDRETVLSLVHTAGEQAHRLNRLVANLLEMTRMEAGVTRLRPEPLDVGDVIGTALQRVEEVFPGRTFVADVPPDLPLVPGDFVLLVQVLVNLLENAAKYSPEGQAVTVSAACSDGGVAIRVSDRGAGIPVKDRQRVFDKFFRADRAERTTGSGLGLAICKGLVEAHKGTIEVGDGPGGGTTMTVRLPAADTPE